MRRVESFEPEPEPKNKMKMTPPQITPGTWETSSNGTEWDVCADNAGDMIADLSQCGNAAEQEANARAIAALPECLAALADCLESLSRLPDSEAAYRVTCISQARAALESAGYSFQP